MGKHATIMELPLPEKIAKARKQGSTLQAMELARHLFNDNHNEENRGLVREVSLEHARALLKEGSLDAAAGIYSKVLALNGTPEQVTEALAGLARCGATQEALSAAAALADTSVKQQVVAHAADSAIARGSAGKTSLPEEFHAGFDGVLNAFAHYEAGRDEDARAALQGIGMQSPFLEWKLLLRGLIAYQNGDDGRALENWQRLDSNRLAHRLCATLRAKIDAAFLSAQPAKIQQALKATLKENDSSTLVAALKELRLLLTKENLAPAFRKVEPIVTRLRELYPDLLPRLGQCFFWAIIEHGQPEDVDRYLRVFGPMPGDPRMDRLHAIALEARGLLHEAHGFWQRFVQQVEKDPKNWPTETSSRVQAMIWSRMADLANPLLERATHTGNPFLDSFMPRRKTFKPSAEQCYQNAISLAPDRLPGYRALLQYYLHDDKVTKAKKVAQDIIKRFPDHDESLEILGDLSMQTNAYKHAEESYAKALNANPLNRALRLKLAHAKQNLALKYALEGKLDKARPHFEQALTLLDGSRLGPLTLWAAAEMKAGDRQRAEALIAQALAEPNYRLACRFMLVSASVRVELPPKEKKRIAGELKAALAQVPTSAEILILLECAALQRHAHEDAFHGQKTQEKAIIKFVESVDLEGFTEAQLEKACSGLLLLNARKPLLRCLNHARRKFPRAPMFRLFFVDYYLQDEKDPKTHLAREHLDQARHLIEKLPRGEQQQQLVERMKHQREVIAELEAERGPSILDFMGQMFDSPFGPFDDDEDDDY